MNIPLPNNEQKRLMVELVLPMKPGQTLQRYNIRKLFSDPRYLTLRRYMTTAGTMTIQAREGVDADWNEVYNMSIENERRKI